MRRVRRRNRSNSVKTEYQEQVLLVARIRLLSDILVFAVPNGGKRGKAEAVRMKAEGVLPGVPDLVIPEPRGGFCGLYVEVKRTQGGRLSEAQEKVIAKLRARGYFVITADKGSEHAFNLVKAYLALGSGARELLS